MFLPFDQAMTRARTCRSPRRNPPSNGEDEPAKGLPGAPTKDSNTLTPSPLVSRAQTAVLALALPLVPSSTKELC